MEFTVERTLRRRGRRWLTGGLVVIGAAVVWLVASRSATGPLTVGFLAGLAAWSGAKDLRRARRPFRLRVDAFGITLQDAELAWEQIDAVSLWHVPNTGEDSETTTPPKPRLTLWTAPGVAFPRKPDRARGDRPRYTLVDCEDLDQSVSELTAVLAEHGGAAFETAPRGVRPPIPVTVSGPELRVPGGERQFVDGRRAGTWTLVWAALSSSSATRSGNSSTAASSVPSPSPPSGRSARSAAAISRGAPTGVGASRCGCASDPPGSACAR